MLYCIEVDRSGLPEENMVLHVSFDMVPSEDEIFEYLEGQDCGWDKQYCKANWYNID